MLSDRPMRDASGIMLIETLIASLIVIVVVAGAVLAVQTGSRVMTRNAVKEQQHEIAQRALDEIKGDRELQRRCNNQWNSEGDVPTPCVERASLASNLGVYRDDDGRLYLADRVLQPRDDVGDDSGEPMWDESVGSRAVNDFDHNFNTRDYYDATVTVRLADSSVANVGVASGRSIGDVTLAQRIWFSGLDNKERGTLYFTVCEHYRKDRAALTVRCRDSNISYSDDPGSPYYRQGPFCDAQGRCGFAPSIPQAKIQLRRVDNEIGPGEWTTSWTAQTDNFGFVAMDDVPEGDYVVEQVDTPGKVVPFEVAYTLPSHIHVNAGSIQEVHVTMVPTPVDLEVCFNMVYRQGGAGGSWPTLPDGSPAIDTTDPDPGSPGWLGDPDMGAGTPNAVNATNFLWKERGSPIYRASNVGIDTNSGTNCVRTFDDPLGYALNKVFTSQFLFEVERVLSDPTDPADTRVFLDVASVYGGSKDAPDQCVRRIPFFRKSVSYEADGDVPRRIREAFYPDRRMITDERFAYDETGRRYSRESVVFQYDMIENTPLNRLCINFVSRPAKVSAGDANPPKMYDSTGTKANGNNVPGWMNVVSGG